MRVLEAWLLFLFNAHLPQDYLATQAQLQLMEEATPSKTLRSREGE